MTGIECLVLQFLDGRMEANTRQIGTHLVGRPSVRGSNYVAVGAAVCARLRRQGFVMKLPELNAWRITRAGREALAALKTAEWKT